MKRGEHPDRDARAATLPGRERGKGIGHRGHGGVARHLILVIVNRANKLDAHTHTPGERTLQVTLGRLYQSLGNRVAHEKNVLQPRQRQMRLLWRPRRNGSVPGQSPPQSAGRQLLGTDGAVPGFVADGQALLRFAALRAVERAAECFFRPSTFRMAVQVAELRWKEGATQLFGVGDLYQTCTLKLRECRCDLLLKRPKPVRLAHCRV
mmetsp:Transcript_78209/g.234386  ORF Transcript_78209/g.234386 Transcript_78209/m.234386 type:complete len:208 (+) Transcript_78209:536-1159(+)|eukprot:1092734-Prymnesium_polylepis.1